MVRNEVVATFLDTSLQKLESNYNAPNKIRAYMYIEIYVRAMFIHPDAKKEAVDINVELENKVEPARSSGKTIEPQVQRLLEKLKKNCSFYMPLSKDIT